AFAAPAHAAPPPVHANAYVVEDARTGEVLAASHAHEHLAIASLTKMMTVLLALQRHQLSDVVTVDPRAAVVGESTIDVRAGERRRADAAHVGRPAGDVPPDDRRQDRPHVAGGLVPGSRGARPRRHDLRHDPRRPVPVPAERRPRVAARLGARAVPRRAADPG